MYASDYDDKLDFCEMITDTPMRNRYVTYYYPNDPSVTQNLLYSCDLLQPYVKNWNIFQCPSRADDWIGYSRNLYLGYCGNHPTRTSAIYTGVPLGSVEHPAEVVYALDHHEHPKGRWYWIFIGWPTSDYGDPQYWPPLHNGGRNVLLLDGHAKWYKDPQYFDVSTGGVLHWYLY